MGKSTISMAIFNSYVQLPEGIGFDITTIPGDPGHLVFSPRSLEARPTKSSSRASSFGREAAVVGPISWTKNDPKTVERHEKPQHNMWKDLVIPWVLQVEILGVSSETARCSIVTDLCWRLVGFSWNDDQHPNKSIEYTAWFFCVYIKKI